jgi:hypothetical protein
MSKSLSWLRHRRIAALLVVLIAVCAGSQPARAWPFHLDEGERLSEQIARAANHLQRSSDSEMTITYRPREGVQQHYTVFLAKVRWQPHPPFESPYPGLTVTVEKGNGGFCNAHVKAVGVPESLQIKKFGEPTEIVLRKAGNEIDVVALR